MPVALNGRVPVKVSSSSEAIEPGDYLTTSTESRQGLMKATGPGYVIGKALAAWDPSTGEPTVMVYVEPGYYNGPDASTYVQNGGNATLSGITVSGTSDFADLNASGTKATITNLVVTGDTTIKAP